MIIPKCTLLFVLILTLLSDPILGKRGFGGSHSYPKSGGLSGGGHHSGGLSGGGHSYPSSGGHSGGLSGGGHVHPPSGGSHSYPSSGGSSGGIHSYPSSGGSSGGSHSYPSSGGSHSYPSSGGSHSYPSSGGGQSKPSSGYPSSGGSHSYPSSGNSGGLSGGGRGSHSNNNVKHTTTVHNHYHYSPPQQITYTSVRGGAPISYPVYRGTPPTYVYQYKDSGSKYGTLLAGLALMNLGTLGVATYAAHQSHQNHGSAGYNNYKPQPGEVCKFAVKKENGDYEETRIDCQIISGFIMQDMEAQKTGNNSTITTTVTNVTVVNTTNVGVQPPSTITPAPNVLYSMLPNGTLVPVNTTGVNIPGVVNINQTGPAPANSGSSSVVVTTTTTNTTLVSALDVKGKPVEVTPGMQCFVIRHSPISNMRKNVPCGLLQTYADRSLKRNSATKHLPMFTLIAAVVAYCVAY